MKNLTAITCLLFIQAIIFSCEKKAEATTTEPTLEETKNNDVANEKVEAPTNQSPDKEAEVLGDLDKDGIDEKIIVTNTSEQTDFGITRKISIFKLEDKEWKLWHESMGAVLPSEHGGMMGEPFEGISIANGCIIINHFGGSRSKWSYTHTYRYQKNDWYLIGATISFGEPACEWNTFDYNLSTGKLEVKKNKYACDDEALDAAVEDSTFEYSTSIKLDTLPHMDGFYPGDNKVQVPNQKDIFYY